MLQQTLRQAKVLQLDVAPLDTLPTLQDIDTLQVVHSLMHTFYVLLAHFSVSISTDTTHTVWRFALALCFGALL